MYYFLALWTSRLFLLIKSDFVSAESQLIEGIDSSSLGSDTLGDWYLDSNNPVELDLDDFIVPSSFESAGLLQPSSSLDLAEMLVPQDDRFANEIAPADCSTEGTEPQSIFRTRQACMETLILPELKTPQENVDSKDKIFPDDLGIFESYDPFAYGVKDEDSCPPAIFGDKMYSVCDSGNRGDMVGIDQSGYANLRLCKPGMSASVLNHVSTNGF